MEPDSGNPTDIIPLVDVGCDAQWPRGIRNLFRSRKHPEAASGFYDGSYALYTLYNEKTDELDKGLVEGWLEHARDLMILGGLISAAISAFLGQSYINSMQSQDASQPKSKVSVVLTDLLWFLGLGTSLVSAAIAALIQTWIRRYVLVTRIQRNPRALALIRACVTREKTLAPLQSAVELLQVLLDFSILAFLGGLLTLIPLKPLTTLFSLSPSTSNFVMVFVFFPFFTWYWGLTLLSLFFPTLYSTPTTWYLLNILQILKLFFFVPYFHRDASLRAGSEAFLIKWVTARRIGQDHQVPEDLIMRPTPSLDKDIVGWLLRHLQNDEEVERFLEGINAFYYSHIVMQPKEIFTDFFADQMPYTILSFMIRTLSSATLPNEIKQKRIKLSLQVMELDLYLLERTFTYAFSLQANFDSVDFVLPTDRFSVHPTRTLDPRFLAKCIIAVPVGYHLDTEYSVRLLSSVEHFRYQFCTLWNGLRGSLGAGGDPGSYATHILPNIRTIYNALHRNDAIADPDLPLANYPHAPPTNIH